jgi:eukaryotic-like serine/threonine-protein kinase
VVDEGTGWLVQGTYRIERLLGRGGVGAVYEATEAKTGERVAIKLLWEQHAKDENVVLRFAREAKAASAVASPHIARVLDSGSHEGRPFLVMELLVGEDLGARLRREHRLSIDETAHVVAQILTGLVSAHAAGIVHRDLKPDNILLVERGEDRAFVKIVDFGTSKIQPLTGKTAPLSLTRHGVAVGTPLYMSPEQAQARSDVDERSDLYTVGALAFECLTGRPPHVGESDDAVVASICTRDAPRVRGLAPATSEGMAAFVDKALARDRALRFSSARQMLEALVVAVPATAIQSLLPARAPGPNASGAVPRAMPKPPAKRASKTRTPVSAWTWVAAFCAALGGVITTAWVAARLRPTASSEVASSSTVSSAAQSSSVTPAPESSVPPAGADASADPGANPASSADRPR